MPSLRSQLKQLNQIVPTPKRQEELRVRLFNQIKFQQFNEKSESALRLTFFEFIGFIFHPWRVAQSFGVVVLGIALIITVGVGTTFGATPGTPLYDFKIVLERVPLVVLSQPAQIEKEVELAQKRQTEMASIIASNDTNLEKSKKIQTVAKHLSRNINSAEKGIEQLSKDNNQKISVAAATSFKEGVRDIKNSLQEATIAVKDSQIDGDASDELNKVATLVNAAEFYTLGILIDSVAVDSTQSPVDKNPEASQDTAQNSANQPSLDVTPEETAANPSSEKQSQDIIKKDQNKASGSISDVNVPAVKSLNQRSQESKPSTEIETQPKTSEKNINSPETANQENKSIKDQIRADLETAIKALEASIAGVPTVQEPETPNQTSDDNVSAQKESATAEKAAPSSPEVILTVEQIIDQEVKNKEEKARKDEIKDMINKARDHISKGAFKEAFDIIQKAQQRASQ